MIGRDCKQLELNIEGFIATLLKEGETIDSKSFEGFRRVITLYRLFRDLAKDIRSINFNQARCDSFKERAEMFFKTFKRYSLGKATGRKPYLHILREHIPELMKFWGKLGFGYGYFNCNGGEHLNKLIKTLELNSTNLDEDRFATIVRILRLKQLHFPSTHQKSAKRNVPDANILVITRKTKIFRCFLVDHRWNSTKLMMKVKFFNFILILF